MHKVLVVDSIDDVLMEALFRTEHYMEMCNRGWIKPSRWLATRPGETVEVIRHEKLVEFFAEVAV